MSIAIPTYEFYKNSYGGKLTEDDYAITSRKAALRLDELTFDRAIPGDMVDRSYYAVCELTDYLKKFADSQSGATISTGEIKSETTDGYRVEYETGSGVASNKTTAEFEQVSNIAKRWLTYPTNLLYRGR